MIAEDVIIKMFEAFENCTTEQAVIDICKQLNYKHFSEFAYVYRTCKNHAPPKQLA